MSISVNIRLKNATTDPNTLRQRQLGNYSNTSTIPPER